MKYSFMSFSCPDMDLRSVLAMAEDLGYDGFEPRIDSKHAHGIETDMSLDAVREVRAIMADSPVKFSCLASSVQLAPHRNLEKNMELARRAIDLCEKLEIPSIRIFGGPLDEDDTRTAASARIIRALNTLSDEMGDDTVTLCMETHDSWCDPAHVAAIMREVSGRHVGVNWDVMHTRRTAYYSEEESFRLLAPYIKHVHMHAGVKDPKIVFAPIGTDSIDHKKLLSLLRSIDYDRYISGEWIHYEAPDHLKVELATMHRYEEELNV